VERVQWQSADGKYELTGILCSARSMTSADAPLLVHAHGGPAISVVPLRSAAAAVTRYPYRHFLAAGFVIFQPLYRWAHDSYAHSGSPVPH
jgi:dipeptidyl aminopeptidase/acylaminoacyl peptidase